MAWVRGPVTLPANGQRCIAGQSARLGSRGAECCLSSVATANQEVVGTLAVADIVGDDEALCAMVATDLSEYFGRDRVFQLPAKDARAGDFLTRVPVLFDDSASHDELLARIEAGAEIAVAEEPAGAAGETDVHARLGADGMPMFVHTPGKDLRVLAAGDEPALKAGQELIGLVEQS
jgi:hypothetical protein